MRAVVISLLMASTSWAATPSIAIVGPPNETVDLEVYTLSADTLVEEQTSQTDQANREGLYLIATDGTPSLSGTYYVLLTRTSDDVPLASGYVTLTDTTETFVCGPHGVAKLDEDETAIDIDGTTLGTVTNHTNERGTDNAAPAATALTNVVWTDAKAAYIDQAVSDNATPTEVATELATYDGPTNAELQARTLVAADYFDASADTVATVTNLTNLPAITSNWLTSTGLATDAVTEIHNAFNDFDPASDKVYLADGAHGGSSATITLSDYSDFHGAAGDPWTVDPSSYAVGTAGYALMQSYTSVAAGTITSTSTTLNPVVLVIARGDDYGDGLPRPALTWTVPLATADLTGYTNVDLTIRDRYDAVIMTTTGSVANAGGETQTISVPIAGADTQAIAASRQYKYDVQVKSATWTYSVRVGSDQACWIVEDQTRQ